MNTNSAPSTYSQSSGAAAVNQLFAPFTAKAPSAAPPSVARPPTATQMAISIELAGCISLGLMMPTWGTYSTPARPHNTADSVHTNSL